MITMNMMMMMIWINYLALQINKNKIDALVSEHYSTMKDTYCRYISQYC